MIIITIDGPAASGKSTVARAIALKLGYYYLNSGMLYRSLGYCLLHHAHLSLEKLGTCNIQERNHCLESIEYDYDPKTGSMNVLVEGHDVTSFLKEPIIDRAASVVGENKAIRDSVTQLQKALAKDKNCVAEGRDAGSVIFPHAQVKFFLTAQKDVRALRWLNDHIKKGNDSINFEQGLKMIKERDERDANRPHAPLKVSADDIVVDNSNLTFDQTLDLMLDIITLNIKK